MSDQSLSRVQHSRWYKNAAVWWSVVPLATIGLLSWAPTLWGWLRFGDRRLLYWTSALFGLTVLAFVLLGNAPTDSEGTPTGLGSDVGTALILLVAVSSAIRTFTLRHRAAATRRTACPTASQAAVAAVEYARSRRAEARRLAERDPDLARELGIGRPDRPDRAYDDGGLIDLNHADAPAMVSVLELRADRADEIVRVRSEMAGFASCDELAAYTTIPPNVVEGMRERAIFLRY